MLWRHAVAHEAEKSGGAHRGDPGCEFRFRMASPPEPNGSRQLGLRRHLDEESTASHGDHSIDVGFGAMRKKHSRILAGYAC